LQDTAFTFSLFNAHFPCLALQITDSGEQAKGDQRLVIEGILVERCV
jgi:hypothetical protein